MNLHPGEMWLQERGPQGTKWKNSSGDVVLVGNTRPVHAWREAPQRVAHLPSSRRPSKGIVAIPRRAWEWFGFLHKSHVSDHAIGLLRRLEFSLPLTVRSCRCGRPLDAFGHHRLRTMAERRQEPEISRTCWASSQISSGGWLLKSEAGCLLLLSILSALLPALVPVVKGCSCVDARSRLGFCVGVPCCLAQQRRHFPGAPRFCRSRRRHSRFT